MPSQVMSRDPTTWTATSPRARPICWRSRRVVTSPEKVEKVVSPPGTRS